MGNIKKKEKKLEPTPIEPYDIVVSILSSLVTHIQYLHRRFFYKIAKENILNLASKISKNKEIKRNYNLLPDIPIAADRKEDIKFGHQQIADVLVDVTEHAPPPFTIGLFGKWGSGKSTIINIIRESLENKGIKSVLFDAWKYEHDSLRRQFLITLDKDLKLGKNYRKTLNQSLTTPNNLSISSIIALNKYPIFFGIIVFVLVGVTYWFFAVFLNLSYWNPTLLEYITDVAVFTVLIGFFLNSFQFLHGAVEEGKPDSAEGFEFIFYNEILSKVDEKILIIIDNLDRTSSQAATTLLSDIKTFLAKDKDDYNGQHNKAVFLIACDDIAIKRHLEKQNFDNSEEFLRKFFNASLRIPLFLDVELDNYTNELIKATGINEFISSDQLSWLITYSFRGNPREIKQFINSLTVQFILATTMQKSGQISGDKKVTESIEFLAKLQIIKQKFPQIYFNIEASALRLGIEWDDVEKNSESFHATGENISKEQELDNNEFTRFVRDTNHIESGNLPLFIRLRQSDEEQKLGSWGAFLISAIDKQFEPSSEVIKKMTSEEDLTALDELARDYIRPILRNLSPYNENFYSFSSILVKTMEKRLVRLKLFLPDFIKHFPNKGDLLSRLEDFPIKLYLHSVYPVVSTRNKKIIIDSYLSMLKLRGNNMNESGLPFDVVRELIQEIIDHDDYFTDKNAEIRNEVATAYSKVEYLELFETKELRKKYINNEAKSAYIRSITREDLQDFDLLKRKLALLNIIYV